MKCLNSLAASLLLFLAGAFFIAVKLPTTQPICAAFNLSLEFLLVAFVQLIILIIGKIKKKEINIKTLKLHIFADIFIICAAVFLIIMDSTTPPSPEAIISLKGFVADIMFTLVLPYVVTYLIVNICFYFKIPFWRRRRYF